MYRTLLRLHSSVLLLALAPSACHAQAAPADADKGHRNALIYPFAIAGQPKPDPATPSSDACPTEAGQFYIPVPIEPKLIDAIGKELKDRLEKKKRWTVQIADPSATAPDSTPAPSLTFAGCIIRAEPGNAAERMAGMRLGASYLTAHVRIFSSAASKPLQEFDIQISGSKLLPPLGPFGLITRAATMDNQTLEGDAKRLADELLKKFAKLEKTTMEGKKQPGA